MRAYRKKWPMKTIEKMLKLTTNEIAKLEFYMHILFLPIRLSKLNWNTHAVRKDVEKSTLSSITHRSANSAIFIEDSLRGSIKSINTFTI